MPRQRGRGRGHGGEGSHAQEEQLRTPYRGTLLKMDDTHVSNRAYDDVSYVVENNLYQN